MNDYIEDKLKEFDHKFVKSISKGLGWDKPLPEVDDLFVNTEVEPLKSFLSKAIEEAYELGVKDGRSILPYEMTALYSEVMRFSQSQGQVTGEKNDYYVTLEQLEGFILDFNPTKETNANSN